MQSKKYSLGTNEMGVETTMEVFEDGTVVTQDCQSAADVQAIMDFCAEARAMSRKAGTKLRLLSQLPITVWTNWRRIWDAQYRQHMNWHRFYEIMINRPEYAAFKCVEGRISISQELKEYDGHSPEPIFSTAANVQRWKEEDYGAEFAPSMPDFMPLTGNDDARRISC